jgi:polyphosphate kinase 2 (PPK2 family)
VGRLDEIDLGQSLSSKEEERELEAAWKRLAQLRLTLGGLIGERTLGPPLCVVFEGWDASGKGGAIKRLVAPLDPRHVRVAQFAAPSTDEKRHHFLKRFWPALPGWGGMTVYDRSWYGRVLVERIEGFASEDQRRRAYEEIGGFEKTLADEGMILVKFWLHISSDEQLRGRRPEYEPAVEEMLERTDRPHAPWHLVAAESKRHARVSVLRTVIAAIEDGMRRWGQAPPPPE